MLTPFLVSHGRSEGFERRLILPRGLTDGGAYHELEDLILAEARRLHGGDVLVGDPCRPLGDLVDQRALRLGEPCVIEFGAPPRAPPPALSFQDPGYPFLVPPPPFFFYLPFFPPHSLSLF